MTQPQVIQPRDERERQMVARYEHDLANRWDVAVGPLMRRRSDGKLIRLPDRGAVTRTDPQVATDAFVLGRGPGAEYGVMLWWIETAREFMTWPQPERLAALLTALRNEDVFRQNLAIAPLESDRVQADAPRPQSLLRLVSAERLGMVAPAPVRTTAPVQRKPPVLAAAAD